MRRALLLIPVLAAPAVLAGCTSSGTNAPSNAPSTIVRTVTQTKAPSSSAPSSPVPVEAGPTKAAAASSCPLIAKQTAVDTGGMRLGRISVLKAGGQVVGCRLFGQQEPNGQCDATCLAKEKLPPGNQPAIEIATTRYRNATDAHNAFVLIANRGTNFQQVSVGVDNTAVCYQTDFYPEDDGKDWACAFSVDKTAVVVRTVADLSSNAAAVAKQVARNV